MQFCNMWASRDDAILYDLQDSGFPQSFQAKFFNVVDIATWYSWRSSLTLAMIASDHILTDSSFTIIQSVLLHTLEINKLHIKWAIMDGTAVM